MDVARLVNDEENDCRFEVQREEHWKNTQSICQAKVARVIL